ncbi:MAG TPA: hypothetical protein VGQ80_09260, partial [Acidimicrobiia bacterium]|nr:hypothetical protein [Acidimicrobiia bacterium]
MRAKRQRGGSVFAVGRRGGGMALAVLLGAMALPLAGGTQASARVSFRPVVDYGTGGAIPAAVAVADVNGDGAP